MIRHTVTKVYYLCVFVRRWYIDKCSAAGEIERVSCVFGYCHVHDGTLGGAASGLFSAFALIIKLVFN
jgi:hypothetical protein